jgi:dephospho-CoA kinase
MKTVIGLIGKVCAGKSTVSTILRDKGAYIYVADKAVHMLYEEEDVKRQVLNEFGLSVFKETKVDRKVLGDIVFHDPVKMQALTDIIYPRILSQVEELVSAFKKTQQEVLVLDAPLLMKTNLDTYCDRIIYVTADDARRQEWAVKNRGWEVTDLIRRDALLAGPIIRKHHILTNNGTVEELEEKINEMFASWKKEDEENEKKWSVKRQDEIGNIFLVEKGLSKTEAAAVAVRFEIKGHKQTYFVEEE